VLLAASGSPWPAPIEHLALVSSTNDLVKERARHGAPEWSVVLADAQTAGRGRHGHAWGSSAGNLHLSVLVRPRGDAATWGCLPLLAGLAVAEAVAAFGVEPALKWPNDVWVAGRKVAGVLVESSSAGVALESVVIGVGVNVATVPEALDAAARAGAACLADFVAAPDVAEVAAAVLSRMRVWYHRLAAGGGGEMMAVWRARALPWWGRHVEARSGDEVLRGRAIDVDESGALILLLDDGTTSLLHAGEVRELRPGSPSHP
jgi:BirA family transcriptional regulator, biotin operon repressor / biotin---[acetyl-CoA-carboxylase] ligase